MNNKDRNELQKSIVDVVPTESGLRGRLLLAPRVGKTKIGIEIIKARKPQSILWVSLNDSLLGDNLREEFIKWRAKRYIKKLDTCTWSKLDSKIGEYDMIILDEEQKITSSNAVTLLSGELAGNIISMTGTPTKDFNKQELYRRLGLSVLYTMPITTAVDMKLLSDYSVIVASRDLSDDKNVRVKTKSHDFMTSEKSQYFYLSEKADLAVENNDPRKTFKILARMRAIQNSPTKQRMARYLFKNLEGRILMFCPNKKFAESITDNVYHSTSDSDDFKKFLSGDLDKIALVNKGGIGATYKKPIDHLIVVQCCSDNNGMTSQKICRTLLKNGKDYKAKIWVLRLRGTRDMNWVDSTLSSFHKNKTHYFDFKKIVDTLKRRKNEKIQQEIN